MKSQLRKRIESFLWRSGGMLVIAFLSFLIEPDTIQALKDSGVIVPAIATAVIGLLIGEVTKWMNKMKSEKQRSLPK